MNQIEKIRAKWSRNELCLGTSVSLTDPAISELYGESGYDFVWLDCEHSAMSKADALNHIRAARGAGAAVFLRIPSGDPVVAKPFLELHPAAIIIPRIESVEDAERAVTSCRYPPRGVRGFGPSRGVRFGHQPRADYLAEIDEKMMVILQIEHIDAVHNINKILDVAGVDSVVTGPVDLSASMGHHGQGDHPDVVAAVKTVYRAAIAKGIPAGHSCGFDAEEVKQWLSMGLSWIQTGGDWATLAEVGKKNALWIKEIG